MTEVYKPCALSATSSFLIALLLISPGMVMCGSNLLTKFFAGYDKAVRPDFDKGKPLTIVVDMYVEAFGNIKEANMEYLVYGYFRQRWKDSRLTGRLNYTLTIKGGDIDNIWVPDPYCYNARESNMMLLDTQLHSRISIDPSGDVLYSKGVTLLASCNMDLRRFPLDSQSCCLKFGSYGYTTDHIIFEWGPAAVVVGSKEMAQFEYKGNNLSSNIAEFSTGNFSTVTVKFLFERRVGYYLIQVYLPDIFVVALSWIVFWMDKTEMGDRMALGITTILTIMFLLGSLNGSMPRVSYPKALDWYLLVSFTFVFLSLIECMIVFIFTLKSNKDKAPTKYKPNAIPLSRMVTNEVKLPPVKHHSNGIKKIQIDGELEVVYPTETTNRLPIDNGSPRDLIGGSYRRTAADSIDKASRVLFPVLFVIYNIVYWAVYALPGNKTQ
ncbi:Gamma-aminobutyric acid receptor subunit alpha-4 [Desmophyllum pertusum]|uniref:Gamma-aminobutyric acid receptor subunit alpha-4 n=1 Tax=Desmophyllum pertusum TaxID=174260 RepID=A0A9X0CHE4_9CNID|nr:Gamma-aminobutyric acid receptor subunit alpha-4 [Desmophyllum pertusum]